MCNLAPSNNNKMIQVKKIKKGDVIEFVSKHTNLVASNDGWILCNADGSFYSHPLEGYQQFHTKEVALMAAAYLNKTKI